MKQTFITMNSLPYKEVKEKGYPEIFQLIKKAGFTGVEVRRELLDAEAPSLSDIRTMLRDLDLLCIYSCPVPLFNEKGELNSLIEYLEEGKEAGAGLIKFSLGHYKGSFSAEHLREQLSPYAKTMIITIENDQTIYGGKAEILSEFLSECRLKRVPLSFTCDIGNWQYIKEDPFLSVIKMKAHTSYIHIKEVEKTADSLITVPISIQNNHNWKRLLNLLPKGAPIAAEFPVTASCLKDYYSILTERGEYQYETI